MRSEAEREAVEVLLRAGVGRGEFAVGKTKVFLRAGVAHRLEALRIQVPENPNPEP